MFNLSGLVGGTVVSIEDSILDNCSDLGVFKDLIRVSITSNTLVGYLVTGGLKFLGSCGTVIFNNLQSGANTVSPTFDLTDSGLSVGSLQIASCTANLLTGTNKFAELDPNRITRALITDSLFTSTDPLGSLVDNETPNFIINRVGGVSSTKKLGVISLDSPYTLPISTQSTPVLVGGSWQGVTLSQFQLNGTTLEFLGEGTGETFRISCNINAEKAGSTGSATYSCRLLVSGTPVGDTISAPISDKGGSIKISAFVDLQAGADITFDISNESSTSDLDISSVTLEAYRVT